MHHLLKTIENQGFEMALICADNKELFQTWYSQFFCLFSPTVMKEDILDVMLGWRTLRSANKQINK
jgi:hypothetical protein